jgi:hypothetical protein
LSVEQILGWADAHHERTGRWPSSRSGPIPEAPGESWSIVATALANGSRGLPAGQSLPELLADHRGHRNKAALPRLSDKLILAWADAHHRHTGTWPRSSSGAVIDAPGEHWRSIESALRRGWRGLPGGDSLARLLARHGRMSGLWGGPGRWTAAADALVRTLPPVEAARWTGHTLHAVYARRCGLKIARRWLPHRNGTP